MDVTPWEVAFLLLLVAILLGIARIAQVGSAMRRSRTTTRTIVREQPAPPAPPPVPPVTCAACGATNVGTNKFCSVCGATLAAQAAPPSVPVVTAASAEPTAKQPSALEGGPVAVSASATVASNTCPSCATVNPPGQPFCGQCGTRLSTAAA